jgi:hypothetical protein
MNNCHKPTTGPNKHGMITLISHGDLRNETLRFLVYVLVLLKSTDGIIKQLAERTLTFTSIWCNALGSDTYNCFV